MRPWTDGEFASLLSQDTVFGFAARETGHGGAPPVGFVLARLAAGEGEILTVAVARAHRRQGLGWRLMDAVLRELHSQRAEALFLEVDETNAAAIALYRRLGFFEVGKRPTYYGTGRGEKRCACHAPRSSLARYLMKHDRCPKSLQLFADAVLRFGVMLRGRRER